MNYIRWFALLYWDQLIKWINNKSPNVRRKYWVPLSTISTGIPSSEMADMKLARIDNVTGSTLIDLLWVVALGRRESFKKVFKLSILLLENIIMENIYDGSPTDLTLFEKTKIII